MNNTQKDTMTITKTYRPAGSSLRLNPAHKASAIVAVREAMQHIAKGRFASALDCALRASYSKLAGMRYTPQQVALRACGFSAVGEPQAVYGGNNATYTTGHHQAWTHRSGWQSNPLRC